MQSDLHKQLQELEARLKIHRIHESMLEARIESVRKQFQEECTHEQTQVDSVYVSGTYYDKAYTNHITTCTICQKKLGVSTVNHSYYG